MNFQLFTFNPAPFGHGMSLSFHFQLIYKEQAASKKEVKQVVPEHVKFKYLYNGKELQDELGLNWYDYGARNYQADLGRWLNVDNLSEQFSAYSPYHYAGNNPNLYFDIDGNEFTNSAWEWVLKIMDYMDDRLEYYDNRISKINQKLKDGKISQRKADRRIKRLTSRKAALCDQFDQVRWEIATLATSDQIYDVVYDSGGTTTDIMGNRTIVNETRINLDNGYVEMTVSKGTSIGLFGHELKHAYQFEMGELSLQPSTNNGKSYQFLHDKYDELAGYQRQNLLGGNSGVYSIEDLPERYKNLPTGPISIHNFSPQLSTSIRLGNNIQLQHTANYYNQAFRIKGKTFLPKKRK